MMITGTSPGIGALSCEVDSTSGTVTVPAAALAAIGAGADLSLPTAKQTTIMDQDWTVDIWTIMQAFTPDLTKPVSIHVQ